MTRTIELSKGSSSIAYSPLPLRIRLANHTTGGVAGFVGQFRVAQAAGVSSAIRFIGGSESRKYRGRLVVPAHHALRFNSAAKRQSPITVEFDFVDPIAGRHSVNELCFHRPDEIWKAGGSG